MTQNVAGRQQPQQLAASQPASSCCPNTPAARIFFISAASCPCTHSGQKFYSSSQLPIPNGQILTAIPQRSHFVPLNSNASLPPPDLSGQISSSAQRSAALSSPATTLLFPCPTWRLMPASDQQLGYSDQQLLLASGQLLCCAQQPAVVCSGQLLCNVAGSAAACGPTPGPTKPFQKWIFSLI